ncbi:MAG: leucine-rich repeat protein [Gammaproteobacteria bacterium]|nr:leucine-rich repeat protein [Gammaproteobacteria bacterium]
MRKLTKKTIILIFVIVVLVGVSIATPLIVRGELRKKYYSISYVLDGGVNSSSNPIQYNKKMGEFELEDASKEGYIFEGWYLDSEYTIPFDPNNIKGEISLYAKFSPIIYSINYVLDGGTNSSSNPTSYTIEDEIVFLSPTKTDYTFISWFSDENLTSRIEKIEKGSTGNKTLYASFSYDYITVSMNIDGAISTALSKKGEKPNLIVPTKEDYLFSGWYKDEALTEYFDEEVSEDITLYASWVQSLEYVLSDDSNFYHVKGIGTYSKGNIIIPSKYLNKPVLNIYNEAFINNESITSFTTSLGVETLGDRVFKGCINLESVTLSKSIYGTGYDVFNGCTSLKNIVFEDDIELSILMSGTFESCLLIEEITLPDSITSIDWNVFRGCTSLKSINIPKNVKEIKGYSFEYCTSLESVTFNSSSTLKTIGVAAFSGDIKLKSITLPESLVTLENAVFLNTGLTQIVIPKNVTSLGEETFSNTPLTSITFCDGISLKKIQKYTFSSCKELSNITLPESLETIELHAFLSCDSLEYIILPESIKTIEEYAFDGSENITKIYYYGDMPYSDNISIDSTNTDINNASWFYYTENGPDTSIDGHWWYYNENLEIVELEVMIGYYVTFVYNDSVTPNSSIKIRANENVSQTSEPTRTGYHFFGWFKDEELTIPYDLSTPVTNDITLYAKWIDGLEYTLSGDQTFYYVTGLGTYTGLNPTVSSTYKNLPVNAIAESAFEDKNIESITIPSGVLYIDEYAFSGCVNLTSVTLSDTLIVVGNYSFSGCELLKTIDIPSSVKTLGEGAFSGCESLESIIIPDSVTTIGEWALYNCASLESVTMSKSITSVPLRMFAFCTALTSCTLYDGVTVIGSGAFYQCVSLEYIVLPETVTEIGASAFHQCISLEKVYYLGTKDAYYSIYISTKNTPIIDAQKYYYTSLGNNETTSGYWWYYDSDSITIREKVV